MQSTEANAQIKQFVKKRTVKYHDIIPLPVYEPDGQVEGSKKNAIPETITVLHFKLEVKQRIDCCNSQ